jgi:hypothetical protein
MNASYSHEENVTYGQKYNVSASEKEDVLKSPKSNVLYLRAPKGMSSIRLVPRFSNLSIGRESIMKLE